MIGIIGMGRFGGLMATYLAGDYPVLVRSRTGKEDQIRACGAEPASLRQVCGQKILILAVPISAMRQMLRQIAPLLARDCLVVDVCSVKVKPCAWMEAMLPPSISILATHPMFGPDSAAVSLEAKKIVLCPQRVLSKRYTSIKNYLKSKGLVVIETTPEEHDRQIAVSLALTHFIGRSLSEFGAAALNIDTDGYQRLLHTLEVVTHDTWQLFEDMHAYNPYARQKREAFMAAMQSIDEKLTRKQKPNDSTREPE